ALTGQMFFAGSSTVMSMLFYCFFSSRRRHTRCYRDWSSDVCSSDLSRGGADGATLSSLHDKRNRRGMRERARRASDCNGRGTRRSEERRVGKECRCRWGRRHRRKKKIVVEDEHQLRQSSKRATL